MSQISSRHQATSPPQPSPWRKRLLLVEFGALALLVGSMALLGQQGQANDPVHPGWLLIPAAASLAVFASFIGLMYLRWVASASPERRGRHQLVFGLLALTLLGVWGYGIAQTWFSIQG
ncbi:MULTISPECIES: hypothetical protein [Marinobacter]|uniref:hypothetical protein n=1 Tax=Marinobacter TaxID=2742 RepID=UPI001D08FFFC|nr:MULTISPECIES: hypothetical protein [Marinobacter]MCK7567810.1 hypothetical protein [Marinobacter xestospongiae]UDL05416.1 hypothetical protein J2887_01145 [Marinobacter sp. CA1]